jgi:hypothetical protein
MKYISPSTFKPSSHHGNRIGSMYRRLPSCDGRLINLYHRHTGLDGWILMDTEGVLHPGGRGKKNKKKRREANGLIHTHDGSKRPQRRARIITHSNMVSNHKNTSFNLSITHYKLSYKIAGCNFNSAHRLKWVRCQVRPDKATIRVYLAKCRS